MGVLIDFRKHQNLTCFLFIFLNFFLTSAGYLSWVYHMLDLGFGQDADFFSMIIGYLCQAAGIGLFALVVRFRPEAARNRFSFPSILILYFAFLIPAIISGFSAGTLVFGLLTNLLCGIIAGFYLHALAADTGKEHRAVAFGGGYAAATVASWLVSLIGNGSFLHSKTALILYSVLTVLLILLWWIRLPKKTADLEEGQEGEKGIGRYFAEAEAKPERKYLILACLTILLLSLVKNIGFGFPSSDIAAGISIELSRIFYGVGLLLAGLISDKNRKYGAICSIAALVIPFIMLAISNEPVSAFVFWSLDYFFFGFFSVFRVIFFSDLASPKELWYLAGFGLFFGRIGDALGTAVCLGAGGRLIILIIAAVVLFIITVFLFFLLYQKTYGEKPQPQKSEEEIFEQFSARYELSAREREVMRMIREEKTNSEIAENLCVSESTVKFHIHNLLKKTECKNRIELLARYSAESRGQIS